MDFCYLEKREKKNGGWNLAPSFVIRDTKDIITRGKAFYAIWDESAGLWSKNEFDVARLIDEDIRKETERLRSEGVNISPMYLSDFKNGKWVEYRSFVQNLPSSTKQLDSRVTFADTKVKKEDYISKRLDYSLNNSAIPGFDKIVGTLYDEENREKIEWAIGSIVAGDSKDIQKFFVFFGDPGTGKSTILNIIQKLFPGYYTVFDAKALGSNNSTFSTSAFKDNSLIAIQHDADLSRLEDNTRINSIVSHEEIIINEKNKAMYTVRSNAMLFVGSNDPVKITNGKSGIIRRLVDIHPTGNTLPFEEYEKYFGFIDFELGAIAQHCLDVYLKLGKNHYDSYRPLTMMDKTNVFYNFMKDHYDMFKADNQITGKRAYSLYKIYAEETMLEFKMPYYKFREELKNYFTDYTDYVRIDGHQFRSLYSGFKIGMFGIEEEPEEVEADISDEKDGNIPEWLSMTSSESALDILLSDSKAQYARVINEGDKTNEIPYKAWDKVETVLNDIDTSKVHYVKPNDECHIAIDFDLKDKDGKKSKKLNLEAASKWPPTYAEFSKGGEGIHLHYIYDGDPSTLSSVFDDGIEVKVFLGKASLRRKLSLCNAQPINHISSGLPLKGTKMVDFETLANEKALRTVILRNLNKEYHGHTKPSINFIYDVLEKYYESGKPYDVSDLEQLVMVFANNSTNSSKYCIDLYNKMHFKSEKSSEEIKLDEGKPIEDKSLYSSDQIVFYDVEVFPNLFIVNWKYWKDDEVHRMINPTSEDMEQFMKLKLVGFNCRRYDNHIIYARYCGYSNEGLFQLSQDIVNGSTNAFFREAYNLSYTDIYDYSSNKQSLKKWEIELGIHHQELGLPWDEPVPEDKWELVAEYCDNDVIATEAVWEATQGDFIAREILADVAGMSVNTPTNTLSARIIFGNDKEPQTYFNYRFMGDESEIDEEVTKQKIKEVPGLTAEDLVYFKFNKDGRPIFPGYEFHLGKSTYRGEEVGEGGEVYAEPGMYEEVPVADVASMHPSSIEAEQLFGKYTQRFSDIKLTRIYVKHKEVDKAKNMLDGKVAKYLNDDSKLKALAKALKIVINSVYGLTAAGFKNQFRDPRNKDNIVAKRGALFMVNLKYAVQNKGFTVAHIKTDSIKVPKATPEIIKFINDYGKAYGYIFEHESTYEKMCLVNDAVYIAKYLDADKCKDLYGYIPEKNAEHGGQWEPTGAQFAIPYVFKTLFSHEPIEFDDYCITKSVTSAIYLDHNEGLPNVEIAEKELVNRMWNHKNSGDDTKKLRKLNPTYSNHTDEQIEAEINLGHDYRFVGKISRFVPIKSGNDAGLLMRTNNTGGYSYVGGAKGYRWMEAENLKMKSEVDGTNPIDIIDKSYFTALVDDAKNNMGKYGDVEMFLE